MTLNAGATSQRSAANLPHPMPTRRAVAQMAIGAALLSTTSIFVVLAHTAPTVSAFYRMLFGGLMLLAWVIARGKWQPVRGRDLALALLPALGFTADLIQWHRSILWVGPGVATLLTNFQVFLMAWVGLVFFREKPGPCFVPGMLLAIAGVWLLVGAHWSVLDTLHRQGVWLGLGSGVAYTVYLLSFRQALAQLVKSNAAQFLGVMSLLCASMLWLWGTGEGDSFVLHGWWNWSALLALGFCGQMLAWLLMVRAMPQLPASLVGLLLLLQPVLAFVLDVVLFHRTTSWADWFGLGLALIGILLSALRRRAAT